MRVLIIGGTGFLGPHILCALQGHHLTVLHRGKSKTFIPPGAETILGDRNDLADHVQGRQFDVVIDCICTNLSDAATLVEAFHRKPTRIVMLSSADVYRAHEVMHGRDAGPLMPTPIREDGELRRYRYPYRGQKIPGYEWVDSNRYDKILAEQVLAPLNPTILRLPMIYGPGDPLHRFRTFLQQMDSGQTAISIEDELSRWRGCWGYVENVSDAVALAAISTQAAGRTYNVAEQNSPDFGTWLRLLAGAAGWKGAIVPVHERQMPFHYGQHWTLDSNSIRAELGFRERIDRAEAMRRTVAWERSQPMAAAIGRA
ncbi:MAG: NAD-dependent epimerase/dehydratase family protein [Bryobacterales bacterium]|nr:NAD-dependent epimerase/dehydratase family protein [Bryobacterales bacterium]